MKTKITAIIAILAASVFAFAETSVAAEKVAPEKQTQTMQVRRIKARPQVSPEQREAFVQRILLSLSEENLAKLAGRVAAVQKLTPEQKAEARKALAKPEIKKFANVKKVEGKKFAGKSSDGRKFEGRKFAGKRGWGHHGCSKMMKMKMMKREMMRRHHQGMKSCPCAAGARKAPAPAAK